MRLQVALEKLRRAAGHFRGKLLAIDPHRVQSYSKRRMRLHAKKKSKKPTKMAQMFWALDADTQEPICFTTATASRTVAQATPQLLDIASSILDPQPGQTLVMADAEHFNAELADDDTIIVTYYNAPNESRLREHYENLPDKLSQENIDPHLPWLYNYKLDFRFR